MVINISIYQKEQMLKLRWRGLCLFLLAFVMITFIHHVMSPVSEKVALSKEERVAAVWSKASFPVENFQAYTSGFGYRIHPISGRRQFHNGLDISAPLGSYVRSWWGGEVVALSDHTGCGTMITIQSGQWNHVYCHLMGKVEKTPQGTVLVDRNGSIFLWLGQTVGAGTRIARVGMTGRTTGPHLHWELKYNGKRIDPADVLRQMYAQNS